ncbi:AraC family transcriptional regulator [Achromobacter aloeverae]|uniref:AraC family transcriptional regulator n=1 Tax=Achromobacter aloeverae TaxID=1750518 RepID=A0A4Q1HCG6_9BURK|nr:AraC family transcriptional regulator [Achromobacter aloeverae]RXN83348.1 AraC family transcriptional regulator [Achromobacter aloeverae]
MNDDLRHAVLRYARLHADGSGIAATPIDGITAICANRPTALVYAVQRPLACLVLQGSKHVTMGQQSFTFGAGSSLLMMANVPTGSQILAASEAEPYCSLVVDLDVSMIADLSTEMSALQESAPFPVQIDQTDAEVADSALRLVRLLERPAALPLLKNALLREFHYWLLAGRHGAAIRRIGAPNGHAQKVARAIAMLRAHYASRLPIVRLAEAAGMSPHTFHQSFRSVTSMTPLQFQKQLRLIEARRLMLAEGASSSVAAFAVGYESVPQFTREYGRMFGLPPSRDVAAARDRMRLVA